MSGIERQSFPKAHWLAKKEALLLWEVAGALTGFSPNPEIISGEENISLKPPYILVGNHRGWAEVFAYLKIWPHTPHFMAKKSLFKMPYLRDLAQANGFFPVNRKNPGASTAKTALRILKAGKVLGILPEGTRGRGDLTEINTVRYGAAKFAIRARVPILPTGTIGTEKILPLIEKQSLGSTLLELRQMQMSRFRGNVPKISLAIGEPITTHLENDTSFEELTQIISGEITSLIDLVKKQGQ